jgi:hypothetical protein
MIVSQAKGMVGPGFDNTPFGDLTTVALGNHAVMFARTV